MLGFIYHFIQIIQVYMYLCVLQEQNIYSYFAFFSELMANPNFKVSFLKAKTIYSAQISAVSDFPESASTIYFDCV